MNKMSFNTWCLRGFNKVGETSSSLTLSSKSSCVPTSLVAIPGSFREVKKITMTSARFGL